MSSRPEVPSPAPVRRPFFYNLVPLTSRPTLYYDIRSAPFAGIYSGIVMFVLPWFLKDTLNGSDWEVAILMSARPASFLLNVIWAHLCANRKKMPFVLWPGLISRFMIVLVGFYLNSTMVVVLGSLANIIDAMATPAVNAIWRNNYPGTHRYKVIGTVLGVVSLCGAISSLAAGVMRQYLGEYDIPTNTTDLLFRIVFILGGICGMTGVWIFSRIKVRGESSSLSKVNGPSATEGGAPRPRDDSFVGNLTLLWRDPKFGKFMLVQMMMGFANLMTMPVLILLLKWQGANWVEAMLIIGVATALPRAITMPLWGRILQRLNPMQARAIFNLIWPIGFLMIALSGSNLWVVFAARVFIGVGQGATFLLWTLQQTYFARKEDLPRYMGVHGTLTGIRGLIGPAVGVVLTTYLYYNVQHILFYLSAGIYLCAWYLAMRMAMRERKETSHRGHVDGGGVTQ